MPGGFHPSQVAATYRRLNPKMFDEFDDKQLIDAIQKRDPETFKLIDPMLLGAEILPAPTAAPPPKLVPPPPKSSSVIGTGLRVVPAVLGGGAGSFFGPGGTVVGGVIGSAGGEWLGQAYEKTFGERESYTPESIVTQGLLGGASPASVGRTVLQRAGSQALYGGALGGASTTAGTYFEQGRMPTAAEFAMGFGAGAAFSGATQGVVEGVGAGTRYVQQGLRGMEPGGLGGELPMGPPPGPPATVDQVAIAEAAAAQYQAEEAFLAGKLKAVFGEGMVRANRGSLHTLTEARTYLDELARLKEGGNYPPIDLPQPATPEETALFGQPMGVEPQLALPEAAGPNGPQPPPFTPPAPPPRLSNAVDVLGPPPPLQDPARTLAPPGEGIVHPAPPPQAHPADLMRLKPIPGDRSTYSPDATGADFLQPPPGRPTSATSTAESVVSRGTLSPDLTLGPPPMRSTNARIEQTARMGGKPSSRQQPRLPAVESPGQPSDRPYATGPNAGPRRKPEQEAHGVPRKVKSYVTRREGGKEVRTAEYHPSHLPAEDPATYPPDVRREMARMLAENTEFRHQRGFIEYAPLEENFDRTGDYSAAGGKGKIHPPTAGAPSFHDIVQAGGVAGHITRPQVVKALREALLEGKGSVVSDGAAAVARARLASEGTRGNPYERVLPPGAGDDLIGWVDEASGRQATPSYAVPEHVQAAREADSSDILAAKKVWDAGEMRDNPYFQAAVEEGARRGYWEYEQPGLRMEGPGGAGGPRLRDFEGGPPPKPDVVESGDVALQNPSPATIRRMEAEGYTRGETLDDGSVIMRYGKPVRPELGGPPPKPQPGDAQGAGPAGAGGDQALPGMENVRATENALPDVADVPFALSPPPDRTTAAQARMAARRQQGSLLDRLKGEEGVLVFDVPAGDRVGLKKWLKQHEREHGDETWYNRAAQAVEDGEWDRAFKVAAGASAKAYARAYDAARTPQEREHLRRLVKGTPLQDDINAQIVASARARAGVGTAPPVKDFPASTRVTQAAAARGKATLGTAGVLNPGPPQRPLSTTAPALRAGTLDEVVINTLLHDGGIDPDLIALVPGNEDTMLRLFRQVGEQVYHMPASRVRALGLGNITGPELSQHLEQTVSSYARVLGAFGNWAKANPGVFEAAEGMSMGGALRGMLKGEKGASGGPPPTWVRGKGAMSRAGQTATLELIEEIKQRNAAWSEKQLQASLQKAPPITAAEAVFDASYSFRLSQWATAARNYTTAAGRYSVESLDHALTVPIAHALGDVETATLASAQVKERGVSIGGRRGSYVSPRRAWSEDVATMFDMTTDSLSRLKPKDVRNTLKALLDMPAQAAEFLGTIDERGGGGTTSGGKGGKYEGQPKWIQAINSPKVRNFLTTWNRMQEFSARSTIFDSSVRAQVRSHLGLSHLETQHLLMRPTREILEAVGGASRWQSIIESAIRTSLDGTFAGALAKNSIPASLVKLINTVWPAKLAIPFPAFNLARAPRFIWDHNFVGGLLEMGRYQLDRKGWAIIRGHVEGGRLYRGVRAQTIKEIELPATQQKLVDVHTQRSQTMAELESVQRELNVRTRMVKRLEPRARVQDALPDTVSAYQEARAKQEALLTKRDRLRRDFKDARDAIRDLNAQVKDHLERIANAEGINAPNVAQFLARQTSGAGMLGAAIVLRNSLLAEGTQWYQLKTGMQDDDGNDEVLDLRAYGGFVQSLYVADVLNDLLKHTDFAQASKDMSDEGRSTMNPFEWGDTLWNNYRGKYSNDELTAQFAQAFLSISRASGTTLTLAELATQNGWPNATEFGKAWLGTVGQFLATFTVPLQQIDMIPGVTDLVPGEAELRQVPAWTPEHWYRGLMGPIETTPFAKLTQPPRLNQMTGQPYRSLHPTMKGFTGVGTQSLDPITAEARRVGMPMSSLMIHETGDAELDALTQKHYAAMLQPALKAFFASAYYQQAGSPADQRDVWQSSGPQVQLKQAAWARAQAELGAERVKKARTTGEAARRELRTTRRVERAIRSRDAGGPPANPAGPASGLSPEDEADLLPTDPDSLNPLGPPPGPPAVP